MKSCSSTLLLCLFALVATSFDSRGRADGINVLPSKRPVDLTIAKAERNVPWTLERASSNAKPSATDQKRPLWSLSEGIGAPAGVVYDPRNRELYVSQISGEGDKKDGVGLISRFSPEGRVIKMWWISGLNAPKGLALWKESLWVTDIDEVVAIDVRAGKVRKTIPIEGAKFLTGIAADLKGVLYVGDLLTSRVYRIEHGRVRLFSDDPALESPGALLMCDDQLLVAGWGYTTDYSTAVPGSIFYLDLKTRKRTLLCSAPRANWFGLSRQGPNALLAADFNNGRVYRIEHGGRSTCVLRLPRGCAGITYVPDRNLLVVTETRENRVAAYALPKAAKEK